MVNLLQWHQWSPKHPFKNDSVHVQIDTLPIDVGALSRVNNPARLELMPFHRGKISINIVDVDGMPAGQLNCDRIGDRIEDSHRNDTPVAHIPGCYQQRGDIYVNVNYTIHRVNPPPMCLRNHAHSS